MGKATQTSVAAGLLAAGYALGAAVPPPETEPQYVVQRTVALNELELAPFTAEQFLMWSELGHPEIVHLACVEPPTDAEGVTAAGAWMARRLESGVVGLAPADTHPRDASGRIFAFAFAPGGNLGLEMVRAGLAKVDRSAPCSEQALWDAAETTARDQRLGLWK